MLENAGAIVGQRTLQWDLSYLHSGLCLRIGPSASSNSLLEFVIDPTIDRGNRYVEEEHSTGKLSCTNNKWLIINISIYYYR